MTEPLRSQVISILDRVKASFTSVADEAAREVEVAGQIARVEAWKVSAGIPLRFRAACLDSAPLTPAQQAVDPVALDSDGGCLVLSGPTGVGKTYAACAALIARRRGHFVYFPAACAALLDPERRAHAREVLLSPELLVLDDLGVEYTKAGGFLDAVLDEVIWHREANILPTIITTNLTPDAMRDRLSDRIVDRLRGDWGRVIACGGESRR